MSYQICLESLILAQSYASLHMQVDEMEFSFINFLVVNGVGTTLEKRLLIPHTICSGIETG